VSPDDVILVRVYGKRSDLLIDREHEIQVMVILNGIGAAAPIYCRFENGMAYGFVPGVMVNPDLAREPTVQRYCCASLTTVFNHVWLWFSVHPSTKITISTKFDMSIEVDELYTVVWHTQFKVKVAEVSKLQK